jgi:uncharacterized repeat protein (TIGR01451 family)
MIRQQTSRWDAGLVAALTLVGFGLLFAEPVLLTAAVVPLAYAVFGVVSGVDSVSLQATREFDAAAVAPGEPVTVRLTVENTGEAVLPDLRLVDGVPDELVVTSGSPRACLPLQPGESATLAYTVIAKQGAFQFESPLVEAQSLAGSERVVTELDATGAASLLCAEPLRDPPLEESNTPRAGAAPTDSGGSGLEFFATRQYSPGDPMNRIDWRHVAKTGEFVTIQYREEQAARTVLVVDCRPVARVTGKPGYPTAVSLCAYAAERFQQRLEGLGIETSVAVVGLDDDVAGGMTDPDGVAWVDTDAETRATVEALFRGAQRTATREPAPMSLTPPTLTWDRSGDQSAERAVAEADGGTNSGPEPSIDRLLSRLSPEASVIVCTPLLDNWPVALARELAAREHAPTVVSPNVTAGVTPGKRVASIHRRLRIRALDQVATHVVDWELDQSLDRVGAAVAQGGGR